MAAGARSHTAIGHWLRRAPQDTLGRLGFPVRGVLGVRPAASMDTVRRVVERLHPDGLAVLLRPAGAERDRPVRLAADGKSARGSRTRTRTAAHLLAVIDQDDQVIAQLRVPDKSNEVPWLRELPGPLDIEGAWVSADALHTQRETARFLVQDKKAHYLLTVKLNQPTLYARCHHLPWEKADLSSRQANPQDIALALRGHWHIENKIHYVRDSLWDEDRSQIRTGHGPENMATLRNTALNRLRATEATNMTEAVRDLSYEPFTAPLDLLGIPRGPAQTSEKFDFARALGGRSGRRGGAGAERRRVLPSGVSGV